MLQMFLKMVMLIPFLYPVATTDFAFDVSIKEAVSRLEYHCWRTGKPDCQAPRLGVGDQGCCKTTTDTQSAGGFTHSPIGSDRVTRTPIQKKVFYLKDVKEKFPKAEDIPLGSETITAYCEFTKLSGRGMEQVSCLDVLQRVEQFFADGLGERNLEMLYVTNDPLVQALPMKEMMGLFTNNVESVNETSNDAKFVREATLKAIQESSEDTTVIVCKSAAVQVAMFNSEDVFRVAGKRRTIFKLNRASQLEWLRESNEGIFAQLESMLEKHSRLCKGLCDIYITDGPLQLAKPGSGREEVLKQWQENREKIRHFSSPFEKRMSDFCSAPDIKQQILSVAMIKEFCEGKRYSNDNFFAALAHKAVDDVLRKWPKTERLLKLQLKELDNEIKQQNEKIATANHFSGEELLKSFKDNYATYIKLLFTDKMNPDDVCSHLDDSLQSKCIEHVDQLLEANAHTLAEEHQIMECGIWPKTFTSEMRDCATNANESLRTIGKQMIRHGDSFELCITTIEPKSFATPEELRKKLLFHTDIENGIAHWLEGTFKMVSYEFKGLMDKDGGTKYVLCVLREFARRASDLASEIAFAVLKFEIGESLDDDFQESAKHETNNALVRVFVDPVGDWLNQDLKKMTKLPNTCMLKQLEDVGSLIKNVPEKPFASVSTITGGAEDNSFLGKSFVSSLKSALMTVVGWSDKDFEEFETKWFKFWSQNQGIDTWGRVIMLADKTRCQEERMKDFPQHGHISLEQAKTASRVFEAYFTGFREDFNKHFGKFLRGHVEVTLKDENSKIKKEMSHMDTTTLLGFLDQTAMQDQLQKKLDELSASRDNVKQILAEVGKAKAHLKKAKYEL